jgi:hypothetical protein
MHRRREEQRVVEVVLKQRSGEGEERWKMTLYPFRRSVDFCSNKIFPNFGIVP